MLLASLGLVIAKWYLARLGRGFATDYLIFALRLEKTSEKLNQCERPKTILTKLEQRSWIKIEVARGRSAQECFQGLREACGDAALPYRTVARWVKAFREGLVESAVKVRFIVAYDIDGVILHHAVPPRQMVNADYYCRFLQHHLRPDLRRKRRHLGVQNSIILHDNAKSHTAAAVSDLLRRWQWEILEHPPYSPDMSPCDYDLFAKVKEPLRGTRYNTRDELIRAIERSIRNINKDGRADGVRRLPNIWQKVACVDVTDFRFLLMFMILVIEAVMNHDMKYKNLDVHEEVHCIADSGRNRRIDIIAINRNKQTAEIIDPTIRFENSATQPSEVNEEKKKIYEPTIQYLSAKYNIAKKSQLPVSSSEREAPFRKPL
ncbi:hypothetical protein ANN_14918 [Periplaneta americana]|uniref:Transposase n=1 Tax=Periplaneta americana TaxID=6978 RepID=A0ABQ8SYR7_PERAM|nr:hypothetical protein ANN_14918 [Periplaneta americana]